VVSSYFSLSHQCINIPIISWNDTRHDRKFEQSLLWIIKGAYALRDGYGTAL